MTITRERLKELLNYDDDTGIFTWTSNTLRPDRIGKRAGSLHAGYVRIRLDRKAYLAHRLAWLLTYKKWPSQEIDHIDGNRANNIVSNLRDVSKYVNQQNLLESKKSRKSTGFLGTSRSGPNFMARIRIDKKETYLGSFKTAQLAHEAYLQAKRIFHPGNTL